MHDSLGTYRGPYVGKQSERAPILPTFGVTKDRFQGSFCGNLADAAEKPGPGQYYENLAQTSTLQTPSFNAQFNPNLSPKLPSPSRPHTSSVTLSAVGSVSPGQQKMDDLMTTSTLHNHNTAASTNTNNHGSNRPQTTTTAVLHAFGRTQRKCHVPCSCPTFPSSLLAFIWLILSLGTTSPPVKKVLQQATRSDYI